MIGLLGAECIQSFDEQASIAAFMLIDVVSNHVVVAVVETIDLVCSESNQGLEKETHSRE